VIVRYVSPGLAPSAQLLGDVSIATCGPTVEFIRSTALTDPGFCTSVALASDNPGYDFDAAPALQAVIAAFGPACLTKRRPHGGRSAWIAAVLVGDGVGEGSPYENGRPHAPDRSRAT